MFPSRYLANFESCNQPSRESPDGGPSKFDVARSGIWYRHDGMQTVFIRDTPLSRDRLITTMAVRPQATLRSG